MKNCDDMRDYNINGKRKKIINPGLELENNVPTPLTPTPIPIQKRSGFVAPAPPQFDPTITRLGLPQEEIAPIYTQENAKRLRLTKEQQRESCEERETPKTRRQKFRNDFVEKSNNQKAIYLNE